MKTDEKFGALVYDDLSQVVERLVKLKEYKEKIPSELRQVLQALNQGKNHDDERLEEVYRVYIKHGVDTVLKAFLNVLYKELSMKRFNANFLAAMTWLFDPISDLHRMRH